jgi:hypothetical protein
MVQKQPLPGVEEDTDDEEVLVTVSPQVVFTYVQIAGSAPCEEFLKRD